MEREAVPQDDSRTLGGYRKAVYARDAQGRIVPVASSGWVVEEVVTTQAADALRQQAETARLAARAGTGSPLSYWMYARRMDLPLLAQTTGLWQWQVRRHLRQPIAQLKPSTAGALRPRAGPAGHAAHAVPRRSRSQGAGATARARPPWPLNTATPHTARAA